jgi:hypothetical protein
MDSCFEPVIWPEDKLPNEAVGYKECEICTEKSRVVWGEGNPNAPVVIILDNPGAREDKDDAGPFADITKTRSELSVNHFLFNRLNRYSRNSSFVWEIPLFRRCLMIRRRM